MIEFHIPDPTDIERLTAEFAEAGRLELLWFRAECRWHLSATGAVVIRMQPIKEAKRASYDTKQP